MLSWVDKASCSRSNSFRKKEIAGLLLWKWTLVFIPGKQGVWNKTKSPSFPIHPGGVVHKCWACGRVRYDTQNSCQLKGSPISAARCICTVVPLLKRSVV